MDEGEAKMDGDFFSQIVVLGRFTKNPDSYPANSF